VPDLARATCTAYST